MPFAVKDVLQHKRNDRQKREIHEREYVKYLNDLRQSQTNFPYSNQYHLSLDHIRELERSRLRHVFTKQNQYTKIQYENQLLYQRLVKASQRPIIDNQNVIYQQNLDIFNNKRFQQRSNDYKRIKSNNQILSERLNHVRGHLITKQQCENDWKKHLDVMKKTCDYPENIDKFVSKATKHQQKQACLHSTMRSTQWNTRHSIIAPTVRLSAAPLALLLDDSHNQF